jgi:hypothetical protein
VAFTGRTAGGTAATPTQTLSGDTLTQFTARGFSNGALQFGNASTGRVDVVAAENFTDTSRATNVQIFTTAAGAITPTSIATFSSALGLSVTSNVTANNGMFTNIVNVASHTGAVVSVTGNVTGGNVTTAGILTVNSGSAATAIVNGAANATGNIGSSGTYFNRLFAQATTALYADLAEMYTTDAKYAPGTVLVFGGNQEVTMSTETHDHKVAGVVSTNPAHIMNAGLQGEHTVEVALVGRVPVSVIGNISAGDRVVTSNRAGVAEALDITRYQPGVIIGKAVQGHTGDEVGVIEVVVGRL